MSKTQKAAAYTKGRVLAVEDEATSLAILTSLLEDLGYEVLEAQRGREALDIVDREAASLDAIVLDKVMPEMDGLEVVSHLKDDARARHIPVIMVTGSTKPEEVKEGIDAGVFYYLTKPYEDKVFTSVITSAVRQSNRHATLKKELQKHHTSFGYINRAEFTIQKMAEAEDLACFIANCFPSPDIVLPGLAGLLTNAVEHGNLEIGYETKSELLKDGEWREEIERRQDMEKFAGRKVFVTLEKSEDEIKVEIKDEGPGFNWQQYMEVDPARALDAHGRGIAQANKISFDAVEYNDKGNAVTATFRTSARIEW